MVYARCGELLVSETWSSFVDKVRQMHLQDMGCVNRECIDDSVILWNRLIRRSSICCITHCCS
jgi:hypothetical protein